MNPETPWLREQILAVLAQEGVLSTDQVAEALPLEHVEHPCRTANQLGCDPRGWRSPRIHNFVCRDLVHSYDVTRSSSDTYRHLRALEKRGLVQRLKLGAYDRRVFWGRVDFDAVADEIESLEQLLAAS